MKSKQLLRFTGFMIFVFFKVNMGSSKLVLESGSEWIVTKLENAETLAKDAYANVEFLLAAIDNAICIDGIDRSQYPLIMLKDNEPLFVMGSSKETTSEPSINCDNVFDHIKPHDIVDKKTPESVTNK
jgi:hypothetical protein